MVWTETGGFDSKALNFEFFHDFTVLGMCSQQVGSACWVIKPAAPI